ncbi:MAG: hypothetical protein J1F11_06320 [Oscillospiraceae bacterium]|nr:hypothetical protein [Oscillospiraceae bacterium]
MENFNCKKCGRDIEAHSMDELIECGSSLLKGRKWNDAKAVFDAAISKNAEESRAYFGKLLAECECTGEDDLIKHPINIKDKDSYKKAYQFGDDGFKRDLENYNAEVSYNVACQMYASKDIPSIKSALDTFAGMTGHKDSEEMAEKCREKIYGYAVQHMEAAKTEKDFLTAKSEFELVKGYSDADARAAECASKSNDSTDKNVIYQEALKLGRSDSMIDLKNAIKKLEEIPDYNDAKEKLEIFRKRYQAMTDQTKAGNQQSEIERQKTIQRMQEEEEKKAAQARTKKLIIYAVAAIAIIAFVIIILSGNSGSKSDNKDDMALFENMSYSDAANSPAQEITDLSTYDLM